MARKERKFHFIYKTTNLLSGKYYIGMHSTDNLNDGYLGSGKRLRYSVNKYGKENHIVEILEYFDSRKDLAAREREIVCLDEIAKEKCMNLKIGGHGGLGFFSLEACTSGGKAAAKIHIEKMKIDPLYFENFETARKLAIRNFHNSGLGKYDNFKGKSHSEETKQLISSTRKGIGTGETNSQFGTCWITKDGVNKKIKKEVLNEWLKESWVRGRIK